MHIHTRLYVLADLWDPTRHVRRNQHGAALPQRADGPLEKQLLADAPGDGHGLGSGGGGGGGGSSNSS
eukprot:268771-Heterocapsa_arctica.AAC.1